MVDFNLLFSAVWCEEPSHLSEAHQVWELTPWGFICGQQNYCFFPSSVLSGLWGSIYSPQAGEPQREVRNHIFWSLPLWLGFQSSCCLLEMRQFFCSMGRGRDSCNLACSFKWSGILIAGEKQSGSACGQTHCYVINLQGQLLHSISCCLL